MDWHIEVRLLRVHDRMKLWGGNLGVVGLGLEWNG